MTTVYVLTAGDYSDKRVVGVFTDPSLIPSQTDWTVRGSGDAEFNAPQLFELDVLFGEIDPQEKLYHVVMDRYGDVHNVEDGWEEDSDSVVVGWNGEVRFHAHCAAKDVKTAIKIANDRRVKFLFSGKWDEEVYRQSERIEKTRALHSQEEEKRRAEKLGDLYIINIKDTDFIQ